MLYSVKRTSLLKEAARRQITTSNPQSQANHTHFLRFWSSSFHYRRQRSFAPCTCPGKTVASAAWCTQGDNNCILVVQRTTQVGQAAVSASAGDSDRIIIAPSSLGSCHSLPQTNRIARCVAPCPQTHPLRISSGTQSRPWLPHERSNTLAKSNPKIKILKATRCHT